MRVFLKGRKRYAKFLRKRQWRLNYIRNKMIRQNRMADKNIIQIERAGKQHSWDRCDLPEVVRRQKKRYEKLKLMDFWLPVDRAHDKVRSQRAELRTAFKPFPRRRYYGPL